MLRAFHLLIAIALFPLHAHAQALDGLVECPPGNEDKPRVTATTYGAPLSETFRMEIAGQQFAVPIGYLRPWPPPQFYRSQPFRSSKGFQFSFWMPDGRMPEVDKWFAVMNRPCEAGREQADKENFIVDGTYEPIGPGTDIDRADFNDEFVLSNLKKGLDFEQDVDVTLLGEMIEIRPKNYQVYWIVSAPDAPFDAVVKCVEVRRAPVPNELCRGDIWFHGDEYSLYLLMPKDNVESFSIAAGMARNLIHSWRIQKE